MKTKFAASVCVACAIFVTVFTAQISQAQTWDKKTHVTVQKPWSLPGNVVLPAGTYVMRLYDSPSNRQIVEIWNEDETKLQTRVIGIPASRLAPTNETVLTFYERPTPGPNTLQSWFYPGSESGVEFPAPKSAARDLAYVDVKEPEATAAVEQPAQIAEAQPAPEITQPEPAPAPQAQPEPEQPAQTTEVAPEAAPQQELPRTAGSLPLLGLVGLFSLAGAVVCRSR